MRFVELLSTYGDMYVQAALATWWMTAVSFVGAMVLGLLVTIMRVCPIAPLRVVGDFYVQVFRNIPGISMLILVAYALPYLGLVLDWVVCVLVSAILICSAFASENFMSGINTVGVGQIEAARSLGLTFGQMMRLVVIPQAIRSVVPPMTNLLIATMLTTAIASQVPVTPPELTGVVSYINTRMPYGVLSFIVPAATYLCTSLLIGFVGNKIDKRVRILR